MATSKTVILLHGILNTPFFMQKIAWTLKKAGYAVCNWGYSSRNKTIEEFARDLHAIVRPLSNKGTVHFVGFSLGTIIIRYYLSHYHVKNLGRFVMLAPPNHGSEKAETLYQYWWFRLLYGSKSIKQLFASNKQFFRQCGIPSCTFGIIAGSRGNARGYSPLLPGDNDVAVSVASTHLKGCKDFIQIHCRHTPLLFSRTTSHCVVHFLRLGKFS